MRTVLTALFAFVLVMVAVVAQAGEYASRGECVDGTCQVRQRSVTRTRSVVEAPVQAVVAPVTGVMVGTARVVTHVATAPVRAIERSVSRSKACVPAQADPCCQPQQEDPCAEPAVNNDCAAASVEARTVTRTRTRIRGAFRSSRSCGCCN